MTAFLVGEGALAGGILGSLVGWAWPADDTKPAAGLSYAAIGSDVVITSALFGPHCRGSSCFPSRPLPAQPSLVDGSCGGCGCGALKSIPTAVMRSSLFGGVEERGERHREGRGAAVGQRNSDGGEVVGGRGGGGRGGLLFYAGDGRHPKSHRRFLRRLVDHLGG